MDRHELFKEYADAGNNLQAARKNLVDAVKSFEDCKKIVVELSTKVNHLLQSDLDTVLNLNVSMVLDGSEKVKEPAESEELIQPEEPTVVSDQSEEIEKGATTPDETNPEPEPEGEALSSVQTTNPFPLPTNLSKEKEERWAKVQPLLNRIVSSGKLNALCKKINAKDMSYNSLYRWNFGVQQPTVEQVNTLYNNENAMLELLGYKIYGDNLKTWQETLLPQIIQVKNNGKLPQLAKETHINSGNFSHWINSGVLPTIENFEKLSKCIDSCL